MLFPVWRIGSLLVKLVLNKTALVGDGGDV